LTIAVQAVGLDRCQQNTGRAQKIPNYHGFFEPPSIAPEAFFQAAAKTLLAVSE
jgi:hypothetical protein